MSAKVNPIPEGFHSITPHIIVKGAAKAIDFYAKAFGAEEVLRMPTPDGGRLMHAEVKIGNSILMLADEFPEWGGGPSPQSLGGSPVVLGLYVTDVDAVYQQAIAAGATGKMPPADMFWGDRYGKLVDPFGHEWSIATHKEDVSAEECARRAAAACQQ
jgi:PhnB protein